MILLYLHVAMSTCEDHIQREHFVCHWLGRTDTWDSVPKAGLAAPYCPTGLDGHCSINAMSKCGNATKATSKTILYQKRP
jgi:hypothetical protein